MNQTRMHKRCLAFLLAFTLLICGLPLQSFAEEAPGDLPESSVTGETSADGESQLQGGQEGSDDQYHSDPVDPAAYLANPEGGEDDIKYVVYHEVTLALPAGEGEEEREATKMAETAMVPHGDLISSIDVPERTGCLFEGWYYDEDLTMAVGDEDTVEEDITLYAKFVKKAGMEEEYNLSFISAEDLEPDSQIVVVSYGLTEEQAAGFIQLRDFTDGDEEGESRGFILTLLPEPEEPPFAWEDLDIPPFILEQVKVVAGMKEHGILDAAGLQKSLVFLEVDEQSVEKILAAYADTDYDQAKLAQAKEDEEERARKEALEAAQEMYPDLTLETDHLEDRISAARFYLDSFYQELVLKGVDPVTYTDIAEAIGLSYAQEEDALLGYLTEELNLNNNIAVSILNELGVEPEEEKKETARFVIFPEEGVWTAGHQYQVEILDTENLRFLDEEEPTGASVIYNNFNIYGEDVDNLRLRDSVKLVPASQVEGVEVGKGLFDVAVSDDGMVSEEIEDEIKQLSYNGEEALTVGDVVGVYDGELLSDGSGVDGEISYVKILADLGGGSYSYGKVDATEVVDLPDSIVLQDDGSFEDGVIVVSLEALDFSDPVYEALNLSASTELNENDWLYFYTGSMADALAADDETLASVTGIGRVKSVEEAEGFVTIRYDAITEEDIEKDEAGHFHEGKIDLDVPMTDEEREEIEREISRQITESTVMDRSAAYLTALIADQELETDLDDTEYAEAMKSAVFRTEEGDSLTLEEVRRLASGSKVEFKADSKPSVDLYDSLKHFSGRKGRRLVVKYGFTVTIHLPNNNKLVIRGEMTAEQEVMYYYSADYWKQTKKGFLGIKYIYQYKFWAEFGVGSYSALGFTATVTTQTEKNNNSAFSKLTSGLKKGMDLGKNSSAMNTLVSALTDLEKKEQGSGVMGSLPQKYSEFLKDGAEYIKIFEQKILKVNINLDKIGFCKFSIGLNLVSRLKVNCMLGMSISYGVAKAYSITMYSKDHDVKKDSWDIETENLRVNLFLFGNIGFKIGVVIDLRLGLISTAFDSVGLQGEIGVYAELYGFIWFEYTYIKKEKSTSLAKGAMYLDVGIYFTLDFYAQVGFGKYSSRKNLYKTEWPLLTLGSRYSPVDFMIKNPNDSRLKLELKNSQHSKTISADVLKMESMDMTNGKVDNNSLDSKDRGRKNYSFKTADGNSYTQYNEKYFSVKVRTTDASGKTLNKTSFLYDPVDNSVHVLPQNGELELWGEITFTYLEQGLSFSTETYSRTLKVHWKGEAIDIPVYFKAMSYDGEKETLQLLKTEYVTGVKSGQGIFTITRQMVDGWWPNLQLVSSVKHDYVPGYKEKTIEQVTIIPGIGPIKPVYGYKVVVKDIPGGIKDVACGITAGTQISVTLEEGYYIELIYKPSTVHVSWRLYEPLSSKELATDQSDVPYGTLVTDALPQKIKSGREQYSYYPVKWTVEEKVGNGSIQKEISRIGGYNLSINGKFQVDPYVVSWYTTKDELFRREVLGWNMPLTPPSISRVGYTFKAWIRDDNRVVEESNRMPARDMNVYARWEKNKYKVTFIVDGEVVETAIAPYDTLVSSIAPELTELGKTVEWFKYYYYDAEKGARGADTEMDGSARVPDYHIAVVGEWRATPHMVNWKSLDESLGETVARYGDKLNDLYKPELDLEDARYEFVGWYVDLFDGNGEQLLDENLVMPDNDIDIIARWEPRPQPVYWIVDARVERRETTIDDLRKQLGSSYYMFNTYKRIMVKRYTYYLAGGQVLGKTELPYGASLDGVTPELTSLPEGKTPVWDQVIPYVDLARYNPNGDFKISAGDVTPIGIASVPAGGLVVMGHLELNEHTISWQVDGEEAARNTVCYSRPLPEAPELEKEGHHLDSWMVGDTLLKRTLSEKPQDSRPSPPSLKRTRRSCAGRYGRHFPKLAALTNFLPFCCGRV
ncbi:MAG: InlB B-repeat-containing protein [Lachnospiraceae bacterium]|nr:InlB B-repeat-containing protein [Lachnospiraceae bacterium]